MDFGNYMEAIILGAGEGSRMGDKTSNRPKLFLEIGEETIYQHQLSKIDLYCDKITIAIGHGFTDGTNPKDTFNIPSQLTANVEFIVIDDWENHENAYTAMKALQGSHDDIMLICGDVIFTQSTIDQIVNKFLGSHKGIGANSVGIVEGLQDEMTAVQINDNGVIDKYGAIEGHQEIGVFILNEAHIADAIEILKGNLDYWFPVIFEQLPSRPVFVDENKRFEINKPEHLEQAQKMFSD